MLQRIKRNSIAFFHSDIGTAPILLFGLFSATLFLWVFHQPHIENLTVRYAVGFLYCLSMLFLMSAGSYLDKVKRR